MQLNHEISSKMLSNLWIDATYFSIYVVQVDCYIQLNHAYSVG